MSLEGFLKTGNLVNFLETESSDTELSDLKIKADSISNKIESVIANLEERYKLAVKYAFSNLTPLNELQANMLKSIESTIQSHYRDFTLRADTLKSLYEETVKEAVAKTANEQTKLLQEQIARWRKIADEFGAKMDGFEELFYQRQTFREEVFSEWKIKLQGLKDEYEGYIMSFEDYINLEVANIEKRETKFNEEMENYKIQCANQISEIANSYDLAEKKRSADTKTALETAITNQGRSFQNEKVKWISEADKKVTELTTEVEKGKTETNKAKSAATKLNQVYTEKTQEYEQLKNDTRSLITKLNETNLKILKSLGDKRSVIV